MALAGKNLELAMRIRADMQQAIGELKRMEGAVADTGRQAETSSRDMEKLGRTIGNIAAAIAGGAVYKAVISATIEQERVTAQLEQTLRSTGGAAGLTRDGLLEMASAMQQVTTYGDEAVIPAQSLLLTFTKIGREVFPRALETVLDMSTALGQDLKSSAVQLGKALNDPIQGVSALSKVGVQFTEQQKEQIAALVESGQVMDAQKIILAELETQMGGSARAARDTFGGSIDALKNAFGDLLEGDTGSEGMIGAREAIDDLTTLMSDPATKESFGTLIGLVATLTTVAADATVAMGDLFANVSASIDSISGDLDPVRRLGIEIRAVERALEGGLDTPFKYLLTSDGELQRIKTQLETERDLILAARGEDKPAPNSAPAGGGVDEVTVVNKEYEKLLENLRKQADLFGVTSEAARVRYAIERGELGKLDADQQQALLRYAQEIDTKRASTEASKTALQTSEKLASQQVKYVEGLERQAALVGLSTDQVRAYELAEKGLTGALLERAQVAQALVAAEERKQQSAANARTNVSLEAEFLRAAGRDADAALLEIRSKFDGMRTEFEKLGNETGLAWLDKLIPVAEAKVRVDDVQREMESILAEQQRQEQSVNVQQDAGLLTELGARERILDIHRQTYEQLQQIRPVLVDLAQQPGAVGEAAAQALAALDAQLQRTQATTSLLQETLRDGLTSGLTEALAGLANGTMTLREAITALGQSVLQAFTQLAAENLAQSLTGGIMGLFGGGSGETDMVAGATAVSGSAAALATAGGTLITGAAAIQAAATTLAVANGTSGGSGGGGSAGSWFSAIAGAFSGSAGSAGAASTGYTGAYGFAEGGHVRGPGTQTSDSIPALLSDQEYVLRAAVVTQPGMLPLLHDLNARGMAALMGRSPVRHNTGGLAGVPAPSLPAPTMSGSKLADPAKSGATLKNDVNLYLMQNPDEIASMAWGKSGKSHFYIEMEQNAATVRQILGIN